jgi:peptidyl-prolyl cis-trans isomerase C
MWIIMIKRFLPISLLLSFCSAAVLADDHESTRELGQSQAPLAKLGEVVLTQAEIDAAFSKIPPENRLRFIRDGEKVELLVRNLLRNKALAEEAKKAAYDQQTLVSLRLALATENELASEWLTKVVDDAPPVDYEAIAYENYLVHPEVWKSEDRIDVSHILLSSESRSPEAAEQLATEIWEELQIDPARFDSMVEEYSEDPSKKVNGGRFPQVRKDDMVKPFEKAAFAMASPGEISPPVETAYGFHIIRLNRKLPGTVPPFDEVKATAMEQAREKYLTDYRTRYLRQLLSDPLVLPDGATEEMAQRYFGEDLELAPEFSD